MSFQDTILAKYMSASGTWKCADSNCHGPTTPGGSAPNPPEIDDSNPLGAYTALTQFQLAGNPYVNTCSTDPNASSIECNLKGT